jgi:hypothetical protein
LLYMASYFVSRKSRDGKVCRLVLQFICIRRARGILLEVRDFGAFLDV